MAINDPLPNAASASGANMGRKNTIVEVDYPVCFEVRRLEWVDYDYDEGGAYWRRNKDEHIYLFQGDSSEHQETIYVRSKSYEDAQKQVLETYPKATFNNHQAELDVFLKAYMECAKWATSNSRYDDGIEGEAEMLDDSGYEFHEETISAMKEECAKFLDENRHLINAAIISGDYSIEQAGHDFFLDRNRHGAGFEDRIDNEIGEALRKAAQGFGEDDLYVGDDDCIHSTAEVYTGSMTRPHGM